MATRKEQREEARAARQANEAAERERARRKRRIWQLGAALVGAAAIVIAVVAISSSSGGSGKSQPGSRPVGKTPPIPVAKVTDLTRAAAAAGCQLKTYNFNGTADRMHVPDGQTVHYKTNPPSFGAHYQTPASDGDYAGRSTPASGNLVHALEHGRVEIEYRPGLPQKEVAQLETLFNEPLGSFGSGTFLLLLRNNNGGSYDVAAAAWAQTLTCPHFNPQVFDALRDFRATYTLKGPEQITQPE